MLTTRIAKKDARWPQSLRSIDLFAHCSSRELNRIGTLLTGLQLDAGDVLVREGVYGRQFMIIAEGQAAVKQGRRQLGVVGPGSFVGEMALLESVPRSATVTAVTPLTVYVCNAGEFGSLLRAAPSVKDKILRAAAERHDANAKRTARFTKRSDRAA